MSNLGTNGLLLCDTRPASSRLAGQVVIQVWENSQADCAGAGIQYYWKVTKLRARALRKLAGKGAKRTVSFVLCITWVLCAR